MATAVHVHRHRTPGNYTLRASAQQPPDGILWTAILFPSPQTPISRTWRWCFGPARGSPGASSLKARRHCRLGSPFAQRPVIVTPRAVPGSVGSLIGVAQPSLVRAIATPSTSAEYVPGAYMMTVSGIPPGWILKIGHPRRSERRRQSLRTAGRRRHRHDRDDHGPESRP
jgi:hypothetical protein